MSTPPSITPDSLANFLASVCLYALTDAVDFADDPSAPRLTQRVESLVAGGVTLIQLRDKNLNDRQLVQAGRLILSCLRGSKAKFIMNDRPDLAHACDADGVHLGQEDLTVAQARAIVGKEKLIGLSTHSIQQAREGVQEGPDYIAVGPVFPSATKAFDHYVGVELLKQVSREISLPSFAIGGINAENVQQVVDAGFRRIAVSSYVTASEDPTLRARKIIQTLSRVV